MTTTVFSLDDLTRSLLIGSVVLLVAVVAVRLSVRSGVPALLLFLLIGLGIGESGLGIRFDDDALTQVLGYAALVLILAEGRGALEREAFAELAGEVALVVPGDQRDGGHGDEGAERGRSHVLLRVPDIAL